MKKLWKDFERLSAECYINMGKGKTDMMQWHQAFDALMGAIEETRSRNPDFAGEFYEVDEQTDFEYGVDDWLLDYLDELGMRNLHEKCCEVCEKVIGLFAWKEQLPEDFVVICNSVGGGLVPIERFDREWRELVGRTCCALAAESSEVWRIFCGLPQRLK